MLCPGRVAPRQGLVFLCLKMPKPITSRVDIYHIYARASAAVLLAAALLPLAVPAQAADGGKPKLTEAEVEERMDRVKDAEKEPAKRIEAARDLGKEGSKAAKKAIRKAFKKEKNPQVKARFIEAFGEKPDKDAVAELSDLAREDESPDARMAAVKALGLAGDEAAVPLLIEKFNDEKEELGVRLRAADGLTRYPSDRVFEVYVKALDNPVKEIRAQAVVSMYNAFGYDKPRVRPHLERMLKDPAVGATAKVYLERLGN